MRARVARVVTIGVLVLVPGASAAGGGSGGTLLFFAQTTVDGGLYAQSVGGSLRLLVTGARDTGLAWSPDGTRFLFERNGDPVWQPDLWVSDASGANQRLLLRDAGLASWSPDGRSIAFLREGAIWIARADGSRARAVTHPAPALDSAPSWSSDGRLIAFLRAAPPGTTGASTLLAVKPNGTGLRSIAQRVYVAPSWSPDGSRIAFESSGPAGTYRPVALYTATASGTRLRRVVVPYATASVAWSPDGGWIAVVGAAPESVSIVHPDGTGLRRLFAAAYESSLSWSPDSTRLAVSLGMPSDIWVVDLKGNAHRLTAAWRYGYYNEQPRWQPGTRPPHVGGTVVSQAVPTEGIVIGGVLEARRQIAGIAADGDRVAIAYGIAQGGTIGPGEPVGCIETWDASTGAIVHFDECGVAASQPPAFAGDQLALPYWEHAAGTNSYGIQLSSVERPAPGWVTGLCPPTSSGFCIRSPVGDAVGEGSLLVFDAWAGPEPYCNTPCPPPKHDSVLFRVDGGAAVQIASSSGELTPLGVDADRILVSEGGGTLAILDRTGATRTTAADPGLTEASLGGADLVAHRGSNLDAFDAATGALRHTWPLPDGAAVAGVQSGIVVYVANDTVHLLRLADGKDAALPTAGRDVHAAITAAGLFESYTADDAIRPGRVSFVPLAAVLGRFGG